MTGVIYKITNQITGKIYIGQSRIITTIAKLIRRYTREIKYSKSKRLIVQSLKKHGIKNFEFEIIHCNIPFNVLDVMERNYIEILKARCPNGYNLAYGGNSNYGYRWSKKSKKLASNFWKGKRRGINNPFYGKIHTKDSLISIINSNKRRRGIKTAPMKTCIKNKISKTRKQRIKEGKIIPWNKNIVHTAILGKKNPNYKFIDKTMLLGLLIKKKSYQYICKKLNLSVSSFYRKLKEHNLRKIYDKQKVS